MPYPFTLGSVLLRTQRTILPRTFCRYKSITAAIEKGRGSGPGRFSGPRSSSRPRTSFHDDQVTSPREERDGGRSRPSRSKSSIGARRRRWEDDDAAPRRKEMRKSGGRPDESAVDRRIRDQDSERPSYGRDKPSYGGDKPSYGGDKPSYGGDKPSYGRDRPSYGRDRPSYGGDRPKRFEYSEPRQRPDRFADRPGGRATRTERREGPPRDRHAEDGDRPQRRAEKTFDRSERPAFDRGERSDERRSTQTFDRNDKRDERRSPRSFDRNDKREDRRSPRTFDRDDKPDERRSPKYDRDDRTSPRHDREDRQDDRKSSYDRPDRAPESLPYTTAASEFIYGYSSVLAAIRANRRQYYKLYVNARGLNRDILLARAKASNLRQITREVGDQYDRAFDKASSGRPHNGFILEASPLPVPPITELAECPTPNGKFEVVLGPQTKEELAITGTRTSYPSNPPTRFPLILYLDGILDEGNLGAIARSAYFLGAAAIVTPIRQSAPWSHIAVKASAGAAESIPIFKTTDPVDFLGKASRNGWRCYAADAVPAQKGTPEADADAEDAVSNVVYTIARSTKRLDANHSPVTEHPTILMLGAEGAGLKSSLLNLAHYKVGITHARNADEVGVDSLNVSVAAGVLCHDMLKRKEAVVVQDPENVVF